MNLPSICRAARARAYSSRQVLSRSAASSAVFYPSDIPGGWQLLGRTPLKM
ncbi:carboxyltransferase domain-containing protein [Mesorhizobium sp.]|uniref:carboxyltransferase domain-containing protein n=1 Tax=Mesorhizobium sp. TaxID=1871066 RepID=UPI00342D0EC6